MLCNRCEEMPSKPKLDFRGNCRKTSITVFSSTSVNSKFINVLLVIDRVNSIYVWGSSWPTQMDGLCWFGRRETGRCYFNCVPRKKMTRPGLAHGHAAGHAMRPQNQKMYSTNYALKHDNTSKFYRVKKNDTLWQEICKVKWPIFQVIKCKNHA